MTTAMFTARAAVAWPQNRRERLQAGHEMQQQSGLDIHMENLACGNPALPEKAQCRSN